ncbi:hypothetical protein [Bordetella hinzii]|uniref:hypothetical protein n=1 Tax=Bordetella hinzii TaxID=103855 RepID=UPI000764C5EE|nr:hypothetical protein [Bordetella hinzii]KXA72516.1 hypothetical protein AXA74_12855 [Bordetella hinzii LMG 13501]VEH25235.1 Uncharacterised protein [Bordetella hinzii]
MNGQIQRIRDALRAYSVPGSPVSKADCLAEIQRIADEHNVDLHTDDVAVDVFASAMKQKLAAARAQGRGGWEQCDPAVLSQMLRAHVEKGDPRDVANFCCFLWVLGASISPASSGNWLDRSQAEMRQAVGVADAVQRAHENGYAEGLATHHDHDVRDAALEDAALVADKKARIGIMRSLEATYKADAAREIAEDIRALKTTALVAREA